MKTNHIELIILRIELQNQRKKHPYIFSKRVQFLKVKKVSAEQADGWHSSWTLLNNQPIQYAPSSQQLLKDKKKTNFSLEEQDAFLDDV